ncbi:glycosyltransferase family 25 protein [Annulohypoxylon truncatum]|uniref:glycosyltransferase family 25 protein n=1 Tax=Annulohypoxylon truncatum TaxID=327061 RepID=UPI002008923B|nr:glycosyltransferase family 25 protein [Annulohypoxylon truncatum]KAI1206911.1 glycosyltransferase family 25 protein [Annulohypoxylon truncatum]
MMIGGRPNVSLVICAVVFGCIFLTYLGSGSVRNQLNSTSSPTRWVSSKGKHEKSDVFNKTLGFEKVFVIGLPERSDKRDALTLMSSLTGFQLSWIDGVLGKAIPDKALPFGWNRETMSDSNLGSWRGHINAMRRIVEDGISSALIMEDDMDWDVHVKGLLAQFAEAARALQKGFHQDQRLKSPSPYGLDWDMLWLGSCITTFDEDLPEHLQIPYEQRDARKILIRNDPTVPPTGHLLANGSFSWDDYPPQTRIVYVPGDNVCSFAYALSAAGAQKALQYMGLEGQQKPFDNHLSDLCRLRVNGMRCVSIVPSLFVHHRPRGKISGDSDINNAGEAVREVGFTENVLYSTRLNLRNLVTGLEPEKQWTD